eukprot:Skav200419  [mRNA]  locus=scaffold260:14284:19168:+ [translate_table: standard]
MSLLPASKEFSDCLASPNVDQPVYNDPAPGGAFVVARTFDDSLGCGEEEQQGQADWCSCFQDQSGQNFFRAPGVDEALGDTLSGAGAVTCLTRGQSPDFTCGDPANVGRNPHRTCSFIYEDALFQTLSVEIPANTRVVGVCIQLAASENQTEANEAQCQVYDTPVPSQCSDQPFQFELPLARLKSFNFLVECCDTSLLDFSDCLASPIVDQPVYNPLPGGDGGPFAVFDRPFIVFTPGPEGLECGAEEVADPSGFCSCFVNQMGTNFLRTAEGFQEIGAILGEDICFTRGGDALFTCTDPANLRTDPYRTCQYLNELEFSSGSTVQVPPNTRITGLCLQPTQSDAVCDVYDVPVPSQCSDQPSSFTLPPVPVRSFSFLVECCDPSLNDFSDCLASPIVDQPVYNPLPGGDGGPFAVFDQPFIVFDTSGGPEGLACGAEEVAEADPSSFCSCFVNQLGINFLRTAEGFEEIGAILGEDICFTRGGNALFTCTDPANLRTDPYRTCQYLNELEFSSGSTVQVPPNTRITGLCLQPTQSDAVCDVYDVPVPSQCSDQPSSFTLPPVPVRSFSFLVECCETSTTSTTSMASTTSREAELSGDPHVHTFFGKRFDLFQQGTFLAWSFSPEGWLPKEGKALELWAHFSGQLFTTQALLLHDKLGGQVLEMSARDCQWRHRNSKKKWALLQHGDVIKGAKSGINLTSFSYIPSKKRKLQVNMITASGFQDCQIHWSGRWIVVFNHFVF